MEFKEHIHKDRGSLVSQVKSICERLAPHGWKELFQQHDLDIESQDLLSEFLKKLIVDRTQPGFEDFSLSGDQAIKPYQPSFSLLYHAFASPQVVSFKNKVGKERKLSDFPTLEEIHIVENLVYGIVPVSIPELRVKAEKGELAIAVFCSEYRPAINTVHQKHADLCFSRVGVSRIGNSESKYLPQARGYLPFDDSNDFGVRTIPAFFSAYIAVKKKGDPKCFGPLRFKGGSESIKEIDGKFQAVTVQSDCERDFWVPIHKLFSGNECIRGLTLSPRIFGIHLNEKIRKVHKAFAERGFENNFHLPVSNEKPYSFKEGIAEITALPGSAACLVEPIPHPNLIEEARLKDGNNPVTYIAPVDKEPFRSSVIINSRKSGARSAPEYVHVRHSYDGVKVADLNEREDMIDVITKGGYQAVHYVDFTGEGAVQIECAELSFYFPETLPAYSMVAAVDFFPLVKQHDLVTWWKQSVPEELTRTIWPSNPGPPQSLCDVRYPANLSLTLEKLDIQNERRAIFRQADDTISTIVSLYNSCDGILTKLNPLKSDRMCTLPDGASGVFAPGWDCSIDRTEEVDPSDDGSLLLPGVTFFNNYGLGSPFPEDAMLCAALSSFWPAAAPDITRVFLPGKYATATPLTDDVIGLSGGPAWNQIPPPVLNEKEQTIEYQRIEYSDFVNTALSNKFNYTAISRITAEEYAARTIVMARVYVNLGAISTEEKREWVVYSFRNAPIGDIERVAVEAEANVRMSPEYSYRFIVFKPLSSIDSQDFRRRKVKYYELITLFADPQTVVKKENDKWTAFRY